MSHVLPFVFLILIVLILVLGAMWRDRLMKAGIGLKIAPEDAEIIPRFSLAGGWLTCLILMVLVGVFYAEWRFATMPWEGGGPTVPTLVAMGGLKKRLVLEGEWYRLVTAPFLHAGWLHLLFNSIGLFYGGLILEKWVGRWWLLALYAVSAACGAALSFATNPPVLVSVGASGAVTGLFAAILVVAFRLPRDHRHGLMDVALRVLVPSLLPLITQIGGLHIDYGAHLGGALGGAAMALTMLAATRGYAFSRSTWLAAPVALAGLAACAYGYAQAVAHYPQYASHGRLMPAVMLQLNAQVSKEMAQQMLDGYPHDPRAHYFYAVALVNELRFADAEKELRIAVAQAEAMEDYFDIRFIQTVRAVLALVVSDQGRQQEALTLAQEPCRMFGANARPEARFLSEAMANARLCN